MRPTSGTCESSVRSLAAILCSWARVDLPSASAHGASVIDFAGIAPIQKLTTTLTSWALQNSRDPPAEVPASRREWARFLKLGLA